MVFKTIVLVAYISAVNFYNCPFEVSIDACNARAYYNFLFLLAFTVITRLFELVNCCILSIQSQEREADPVQATTEPVEAKNSGCALKIASWSGRLISVVGAIIVVKALYKGFHAQTIANRALGITETA